jgi:hypothetical protein
MLVASVSLSVLSDVRAYVGGESLWSKGQKDAIYYLALYAETGDDRYFEKYQSALAVPLGDLNARFALEQPYPDYPRAAQGLLRGGNAPNDVPGLIWLFDHFRDFPYMSDAVAKWRATDPLIFELYSLGEAVKKGITNYRQTGGVEPLKEQIYAFNFDRRECRRYRRFDWACRLASAQPPGATKKIRRRAQRRERARASHIVFHWRCCIPHR